jgi:acyl carrier protein
MTDVAAGMREILVDHLGVEPGRLIDSARLADLGADSLDVIEIAMSCEERFAIEIPNSAIASFATVGGAVSFLEAMLAANPEERARRSVGLLT